MITPATLNLTLRPGSTFPAIVLTALDANDVPVDITGWNVFGEVRKKPGASLRLDLNPEILPVGPVGTVTVVAATDLFTLVAHGLIPGMTVRFTTTGTLPTGLALLTDYWVINDGWSVNTFKISAVAGGPAVNVTSIGTGTHTVNLGVGQILIPEITDETSHDWSNFKGQWDLMLEDPLGKRQAPNVAGTFNITRGITNPVEA